VVEKERLFKFKNIIIFFVTSFFIIFPFFYLHLVRKFPTSIVRNVELNYILFALLGLIVALFSISSFAKIRDMHKKEIILLLLKIGLVFYALFLLLVTYSRYVSFASEVVDLTYYHSTIWQLSEFQVPHIWDIPQRFVWGDHFEPIILFIVPIYWLIKSAGLLMIIQAGIVISGIIPLYLVVTDRLKSRLIGLAIAFSYIAFGGLQYGIEYGFHPIMFFPTLFFWMYYFYAKKKIKLYFLFALLCLFIKEEVSLILLFWGLYIAIFKKERIMGIGTCLISLLWYLLCFQIIFPHFSSGGFGHWGQYGSAEGTGLMGIIKLLLFKPYLFFNTLITPSYKIDTIFLSFGAFSFLLFLYPPSLMLVIPSLLEKLLSSNLAGVSGTHYSAAITGVIVVATIESLLFLSKKDYIRRITTSWNIFFGVLIFYVAFFANTINGYHAYSIYDIGRQKTLPDENLLSLEKVIGQIPSNASVSTQYQIIPHIYSLSSKVKSIPTENETSDYVIVDLLMPPVLTNVKAINKNLEALSKNDDYKLIINNSRVVVFKKKLIPIDINSKL